MNNANSIVVPTCAFLFRTLLATTYKIKKVKKNKINQADGKWQ